MGYHLTILRSAQGKQVPISLDEAVAAANHIGGWNYSESPPTFERSEEQGTCTLWYEDGELWTKNPEQWELESMLLLARHLGARVRGDEFETYESTENTFFHPDDLQLRAETEAQSRALLTSQMRQEKLIRNAIVGFFVALGVLGYFVGKWFEKL